MKYDRFLTRIFDKQEKRMVYVGDNIIIRFSEEAKDIGYVNRNLEYVGIIPNQRQLITRYDGNGCGEYLNIGDRFVPMQCSGFREDYEYVEDGMPVFEFDIIQSHMAELFLIVLKDGCWVANLIRDKKIINRPICDLASLEGRFTIKGNKWENPELLEVKE